MELYILDRNETLKEVLSSEGDNPLLLGAEVREELDKLNTLNAQVLGSANVSTEDYIVFKDSNNDWSVYVVREIVDIHEDTITKKIYAEDNSFELIDAIVQEEFKGKKLSPKALLDKLVVNTRWSAGTVDGVSELTEFIIESNGRSALEIIRYVAKLYGLNTRFRYAIADNKIVTRYVDITSFGNRYGKRFEYNKDILTVERIEDTKDLKTAIITYGKHIEAVVDGNKTEGPRLDITDYVWTSEDGLATTKKGQNYIEVISATTKYGHRTSTGTMLPRFVYHTDDKIVDAKVLCESTYKYHLSRICRPIVTYNLSVVDLYAITGDESLSYEGVRLGDYVVCIDHELQPVLASENRVIERFVDLLNPRNNSVTIGDYIRLLGDDAPDNSALKNEIIDQINTGSIMSGLLGGLKDLEDRVDSVINGTFGKSDTVEYNWVKNSDYMNGTKHWGVGVGTLVLSDITGISYFKKGVTVTSNNKSISQIIDSGSSFLGKDITLSAFVKGSGQVSLEFDVDYVDTNDANQNIRFVQRFTVTDTWGRISYATNINTTGLKTLKSVRVLVNNVSGSANVVGVCVNEGSVAMNYATNPHDKSGNGVYDQIKDIIQNEFETGVGYVYIDEGDGVWVYDKPLTGNPTKVTVLKGGQLGIGTWNPQQQKWDIGTFINGKSVNASYITTGTLSADRIEAGTISANKLEVNLQQRIEDSVDGSYVEQKLSAQEGKFTSEISKVSDKVTSLENNMSDKANISEVYTRTETESLIDQKTDAINQSVSNLETTTNTINDKVAGHESRLTTAEQKITPSAITSTVRNSTEYQNDLNSKATNTQLSSLTHTVNGFDFKISHSGTGNLLTNSNFKYPSNNLYGWREHSTENNTGIINTINNTQWSFADKSVNTVQIIKTNLTTGEYGIRTTVDNLIIGRKYTLGFYVGSHRVTSAYLFIIGTEKDSGDWLLSEKLSLGGNTTSGDINNWKYQTATFTAQRTSHDIQFSIHACEDDAHLWIAKPMLVEGSKDLPWTLKSGEVYEGITTIDDKGIMIKNSNSNTSTIIDSQAFRVIDESGKEIAQFGENNSANISVLRSDLAYAKNILEITNKSGDFEYVVNAGDSSGLTTLASVMQKICQDFGLSQSKISGNFILNNVNITINLKGIVTFVEDFELSNIFGNGSITFILDDDVTYIGKITLRGVHVPLKFKGYSKTPESYAPYPKGAIFVRQGATSQLDWFDDLVLEFYSCKNVILYGLSFYSMRSYSSDKKYQKALLFQGENSNLTFQNCDFGDMHYYLANFRLCNINLVNCCGGAYDPYVSDPPDFISYGSFNILGSHKPRFCNKKDTASGVMYYEYEYSSIYTSQITKPTIYPATSKAYPPSKAYTKHDSGYVSDALSVRYDRRIYFELSQSCIDYIQSLTNPVVKISFVVGYACPMGLGYDGAPMKFANINIDGVYMGTGTVDETTTYAIPTSTLNNIKNGVVNYITLTYSSHTISSSGDFSLSDGRNLIVVSGV